MSTWSWWRIAAWGYLLIPVAIIFFASIGLTYRAIRDAFPRIGWWIIFPIAALLGFARAFMGRF